MTFGIQIDAFIQSLSTEKRYSKNTCRAYSRDLESFGSFVDGKPFAHRGPKTDRDTGAENEAHHPSDEKEHRYRFGAEEIDSLTIRAYLGFLHKKNKKVTIAR